MTAFGLSCFQAPHLHTREESSDLRIGSLVPSPRRCAAPFGAANLLSCFAGNPLISLRSSDLALPLRLAPFFNAERLTPGARGRASNIAR